MPPVWDWPFSTAPQPWLDASECIVIDGSDRHTGAHNGAVVRATHHSRSSLLDEFSERITLYLSKIPPDCSSGEEQSSFPSGELNSGMELMG